MTGAPWTREEFLARLRRIGEERYHSLHPFHRLLHGGKLRAGVGQLAPHACQLAPHACQLDQTDHGRQHRHGR